MDNAVLSVQPRQTDVSAKNIRKQGLIPAVYYGKGVDNVSLQMDYQNFRRLYRNAGDNTVIDLTVEGGETYKVLVQQVQYDPVSDEYTHVEFINVNMNEKVTTHVPVILEGQCAAVKELGGTLIQNLDEVEIRCLPADLIHEIKMDIAPLEDFHSALHVSDIVLSDKHEMITPPERTIATVQAPRSEEELEATEGPADVSEVGVVGEEAAEGGEEEGGDE